MKRLVSLILLVLGTSAVLFVTWWLLTSERDPAAAQERPPYMLPATLVTVERGEIAPRVAVTGSVLSSQRAQLGFDIPGRIRELRAREGEEVAAGAVLAVLHDSDQRAQLARAEATAALAERELERWQAGERAEEKRRLAAELEVRRAEAELASREVERGRELASTRVISESQLDALVAQAGVAAARVDSAAEELAQAEAGTRAEEIEVYRAQLDLRRAEVLIARQDLEKTVLFAPSGGSVVRRLAAVGDSVAARQALYELVDLEALEIELEVPARFAAGLAAGAPIEVTLDEAPELRLRTRIDALIPVADQASRNFRALVRLDPGEDPGRLLKPGAFVRAWIDLTPLRDRLLVPDDALRVLPSGTILVRAAQAPAGEGGGPPGGAGGGPPGGHGAPPFVAEWVPVRVLGSHAGRSAVESLGGPLAAGDQVVLTGVDLAFPGVPLLARPHAAAAQAPAGASADTPGGGSSSGGAAAGEGK